MFRSRSVAPFLVLAALVSAPPCLAADAPPTTNAVTLEDVYDAVQTAINRATAARDNAADAITQATNAKNRAIEARDNSLETVEKVRIGAQALVDAGADAQTAIDEAAQDFVRILAEEKQGRDQFLANGCPECVPFRAQLVSLVGDLETLGNAPFMMAGMSVTPVNTQQFQNALNQLPDRALYPLYRMMTSESDLFNSEITGRIQELIGLLPTAQLAMHETLRLPAANPGGNARGEARVAAGDLLDERFQECSVTLANRSDFIDVRNAFLVNGVIFKLMGKYFSAKGETGFDADFGLHGYTHVTIDNNPRKAIGEFMVGEGDFMLAVGQAIGSHITTAEEVGMLMAIRQDIRTSPSAVPSAGNLGLGALMLVLIFAGGNLVSRRRALAFRGGASRPGR